MGEMARERHRDRRSQPLPFIAYREKKPTRCHDDWYREIGMAIEREREREQWLCLSLYGYHPGTSFIVYREREDSKEVKKAIA